MTRRLAVAAIAFGVVLPGTAMGQQSVEDCIAQGGTRYDTPSDATTHQYVDSGGLCADAQNDGTEVTITPIGGSGGGKKPRPKPRTATTPAAPPVTPAPQPAPAPTPPVSRPAPQVTTTPAKPRHPRRPARTTTTAPVTTGRGAAAEQAVTTALAGSQERAGLSGALSLGSAPGVAIAVLAGLGLAGAGVGMRRLNRR